MNDDLKKKESDLQRENKKNNEVDKHLIDKSKILNEKEKLLNQRNKVVEDKEEKLIILVEEKIKKMPWIAELYSDYTTAYEESLSTHLA